MHDKARLALSLAVLAAGLSACTGETPSAEQPDVARSAPQQSAYIGSEACAGCHTEAAKAWQPSHHWHAMQPATAETVEGDFDDASFTYGDIEYRFLKRGNDYLAIADDADGEMREFVVTHTFGVSPLQQYLITFSDGRRQALSVAWDTRPTESGGQRWFHLYPDETIRHGDELHWTSRNGNWNFMCADCHSTDLRKGYDSPTDSFTTSWAEITVGCEACHGPGSKHAEDPDTAGLLAALTTQSSQIDTCARCHSRRGILAEEFSPGSSFLDHYLPSLLDAGLYHPDGQIQDEVYVYGSFLQSKMHQRGVRCTDCHDPHTAELKRPGNATCTLCHQSEPSPDFPTLTAGRYDSEDHHFHSVGSPGSQCVDCHMPAQTYMVVDPRRDHSFRVPRPDLSDELGTPNACTGCHADRTNAWATDEIAKRFPGERANHYGEVIAAARTPGAGAATLLTRLATDTTEPGIVRATAFSLFSSGGTSDREALQSGLTDVDALVRIGALRGLGSLSAYERWQLASPLLADPLLAVRVEAARLLAPALGQGLPQAQRAALESALTELRETHLLNADRPDALTALAGVYVNAGDYAEAERWFTAALDLDPAWVQALANLADLRRLTGRDAESAALLERAVTARPDNASVQYAYGLSLVRLGRAEDALVQFRSAAELAPDNPGYAYAYGIALNSTGQSDASVRVLADALARFPIDENLLQALMTIERDRGNTDVALGYARRLAEVRPGDVSIGAFIQQLESTADQR